VKKEAVTTVTAGRVEYGAIRQHGSRALMVAWRYRVSRAGRWFTCGALKRHYSLLAIGSAEPARRLPY
jgi:hypothetical protein